MNYTKEEQNIANKFNEYAIQLNTYIDTGKEMDFEELLSYIKYVKTLNIDEKLISYSDYLYNMVKLHMKN